MQKRRIALTVALEVLVVIIVLLISGCAGRNYVIHPGAVDVTESKMYDVLLFWNGALTQAKEEYAKGKFPTETKAAINAAVDAYNSMRDIRSAYRAAKLAGRETDAAAKAKQFEAFNASVQSLIDRVLDLILRVTGEQYSPPSNRGERAALPVVEHIGGEL